MIIMYKYIYIYIIKIKNNNQINHFNNRAPVLVAIALIEEGMNALDSVSYIRERRRGAINNKQLKYIEAYKKKSKKKGCIIL